MAADPPGQQLLARGGEARRCRRALLRLRPGEAPPPSAPLPDFSKPELAQLVDRAPEGDDWVHEIKIDGYRVAAKMATLKLKSAYLDGEIAVLTPEGISDFGALHEALSRHGGSGELAVRHGSAPPTAFD